MKVALSSTIDVNLAIKLDLLSKKKGLSKSAIVETAIKDYIEENDNV